MLLKHRGGELTWVASPRFWTGGESGGDVLYARGVIGAGGDERLLYGRDANTRAEHG